MKKVIIIGLLLIGVAVTSFNQSRVARPALPIVRADQTIVDFNHSLDSLNAILDHARR